MHVVTLLGRPVVIWLLTTRVSSFALPPWSSVASALLNHVQILKPVLLSLISRPLNLLFLRLTSLPHPHPWPSSLLGTGLLVFA